MSCSSAPQAQSQALNRPSKKAQKLFDQGLQAKKLEQYDSAIDLFTKSLDKSPGYLEARMQRASCYMKSGQNPKGIIDLQYIIRVDPKFRTDLHYPLGKACYEEGDYDCALSSFQSFMDIEGKGHFLYPDAKRFLKKAKTGLTFKSDSMVIRVNPILGGVNTSSSEYFPIFTLDGKQIIFTRKTGLQEDFYSSDLQQGTWENVTFLEGINTPLSEGAQTISADGSFMLFTGCNRPDGQGSCDIYYSVKKNGAWSKPKNCGKNINSPSWDSQPSLTADGKRFYFASRRLGGYGGTDIYYVDYQGKGKWTVPENIGDVINTKKEDFTPFIHADGHTLFFTSSGHDGLGDTDIFVTTQQLDGSWTEPVNAGYPINTHKQEGGLVVAPDGETAYFSRDVKLGSDYNLDIFSFKLPEHLRAVPTTYVKLNVVDKAGEAVAARIDLSDLKSGKQIYSQQNSADGGIILPLVSGSSYALQVLADGYTFYSEHYQLDSVFGALDPYERTINLEPLADEADLGHDSIALSLNNIFWATGSAELLERSEKELNVLRDLLDRHSSYSILIKGHTDNIGTEADNLKLSRQRAEVVRAYLIEQGIPSDRLTIIGLGETQPVAENHTTQGRQKNRRVEIIFLKK